ncbi:MAG: ABC transporter ATP-binding protein [Flexilinea sp.]|jgi:oligopeptide transport system ATP-binding protein
MDNILEIKNLNISFNSSTGHVQAVRGVSFNVGRGECLGIVGESGSGKSVTSMSILKLLADTGKITEGEINFEGQNLVEMDIHRIRDIRGNKISMIFQDPMTSLNPLIPLGEQVEEMLWSHNRGLSKTELKKKGLDLFQLVRIPEPEKRYKCYPHEFSGGMRQRVMIAMALACHPDLLIADEPTTALDVTIQDQILKLLRRLQDEFGMSIMFITHDLGVVAEICTRVIVMYGGLIMEEAPIDEIFEAPKHPYTIGLLSSIPNIGEGSPHRLNPIPGSPPDMSNPPEGCPFTPRCPHARLICKEERPPYTTTGPNHRSLCWLLTPDAPAEGNPFFEREKMHE